MNLPNCPIQLSKLAALLDKPLEEIVEEIIQANIRACYLYRGDAIYQSIINPDEYRIFLDYDDWVFPSARELRALHANENPKLTYFAPLNKKLYPPHLSPAKKTDKDEWVPYKIEVTLNKLFVMPIDIKLSEKEQKQSVTKKNTPKYVTDNSPLFDFVRKLTKKHYPYDPNEKKSMVPGKLSRTMKNEGLKLTPPTAKKWLGEFHKPTGDSDYSTARSERSLLLILTAIAQRHYNYDHTKRSDSVIQNILNDGYVKQSNTDCNTVKNWLVKGHSFNFKV